MFHAAAGQARPPRARAGDPRPLGAGGHLRAVAGAEPRRPEVVVRRRPGDGEQVASAVHTAWGRTLKDVFQRYKALRGFDQRYQNGFDCQGLWIEVGVERELGLNSKREIEEYGLEEFARRAARSSSVVARTLTRGSIRLGQWMDWGNDYFTFSDTNIEYIWKFLKIVHERGWLYMGHRVDRVVPALRHVALAARADAGRRLPGSRRPVALRALPAARPRRASRSSIWTTTPWTLPANVAAAVNPEAEYGRRENGEWVAVQRVPRRHVRRARQGLGARRPALPRAVRRPEAGLGGRAPRDPVGRRDDGPGDRRRPHRARLRRRGLRALEACTTCRC